MKKLLLAFGLLAWACLFVAKVDSTMPTMKEGKLNIAQSKDIDSQAIDLSVYNIHGKSRILAISLKESLRIFQEAKTAILFYGKPDSSESVVAAGILDEVSQKADVDIFYIDTSASDIDQNDYQALLPYLAPSFAVDEGGNKEFVVPALIAVKDGKITGFHVSLLTGISVSSTGIHMNQEQRVKLANQYYDVMATAQNQQ